MASGVNGPNGRHARELARKELRKRLEFAKTRVLTEDSCLIIENDDRFMKISRITDMETTTKADTTITVQEETIITKVAKVTTTVAATIVQLQAETTISVVRQPASARALQLSRRNAISENADSTTAGTVSQIYEKTYFTFFYFLLSKIQRAESTT